MWCHSASLKVSYPLFWVPLHLTLPAPISPLSPAPPPQSRHQRALGALQCLFSHSFTELSLISVKLIPIFLLPACIYVHAGSLFNQMEEAGLSPNIRTYNSLANVLGSCGEWERAVGLLGDMRERGLSPDVVTYSSLITACERAGQVRYVWF